MNEKSDIILFDYFGLVVYLCATDNVPVHIYCNFLGNEAVAELQFKKGIYQGSRISAVPGMELLDAKDLTNFQKLIDAYLSEIVKHWQDAFIFKKKIQMEILKKPL